MWMCRCPHKPSSHQPSPYQLSSHQGSPYQSSQVDMWMPSRHQVLRIAVPGVPPSATSFGLLLGSTEIDYVSLQNLVIWFSLSSITSLLSLWAWMLVAIRLGPQHEADG